MRAPRSPRHGARRPLALAFTVARALGLTTLLAACGNGGGGVDAAPVDAPVDASIDSSTDAVFREGGLGDTTAPLEGGARAPYAMPPCERPESGHRPLATRCQHLVDAEGRVVVLHGVNARIEGIFDVTFDDGRTALESIPEFSLDDARRMRAMGFNLLRLLINWSALEPTESGGIATAYLDRIFRVLEICRQANLRVLIDFHQDAYSKEIGEDGAPLWAISPAPERLLQGPLRDLETRRASRQVLDAFATFFGDAQPGPRLRTRFAAAAAAVAARFASHPVVVGYEIYNEPLASEDALLRLHTEVGRAIRERDPGRLLFFEPPASRNITDRAVLSSAPFPLAGAVYSPHVYTVSFTPADSPLRSSFTREMLRTSYANAAREAAAWGAALYVTEWGYDPAGLRAAEYFDMQGSLQDEFGVGAAFWLWKEQSQGSWGLFSYDATTMRWTERDALRKRVTRVWPETIAGWPTRWSYDASAGRFVLEYEGSASVRAPNQVYLPAAEDFPTDFSVTCDGATVTAARADATGLIEVACNGPGAHRVVVMAR